MTVVSIKKPLEYHFNWHTTLHLYIFKFINLIFTVEYNVKFPPFHFRVEKIPTIEWKDSAHAKKGTQLHIVKAMWWNFEKNHKKQRHNWVIMLKYITIFTVMIENSYQYDLFNIGFSIKQLNRLVVKYSISLTEKVSRRNLKIHSHQNMSGLKLGAIRFVCLA